MEDEKSEAHPPKAFGVDTTVCLDKMLKNNHWDFLVGFRFFIIKSTGFNLNFNFNFFRVSYDLWIRNVLPVLLELLFNLFNLIILVRIPVFGSELRLGSIVVYHFQFFSGRF